MGAVLIPGEEIVADPKARNGRQGLDPVAPVDLLALLVGTTGVADGNLEDASPALGQLDGQLGLEPEVVRHQRDRAQQVGANRFVASLHVGQIQVGHAIGEKGHQPIADLVMKEQRPAHLAAGKARSENRVRPLLDKDLDHAVEIARVILQVRVVNDRDRTLGASQRGADSVALAAIARVPEEDPVGLARTPACRK